MNKPAILSNAEIRNHYLGSRLTAVKDLLTTQRDDTYQKTLEALTSEKMVETIARKLAAIFCDHRQYMNTPYTWENLYPEHQTAYLEDARELLEQLK